MISSKVSRRNLLLLGGGCVVAVSTTGALYGVGLLDGQAAEPKTLPNRYPFFKGVSFTGMQYTPGEQWPVKAAVPYYLGQKKMNLIRLPLRWELVQPTLGAPLDAAQVVGISDQVNRATEAGAYIVLGMHNFGRRNAKGMPYIVGETPTVSVDHFADFWRRMADIWKGNPKVIFALMNEPHDQDDGVLIQSSNAAIRAIRAVGATQQLILVNGNGWGIFGWRAGASNYSRLGLEIVDSADNFAFDVHLYFDEGSAGQSSVCKANAWQSSIRRFTDWARAHGKRAFCGEFAVGASADCGQKLAPFLTYLEDNRDVWLGWAWWGGGGWWQQNYIFRLDPYANPYDKQQPDPAAAKLWRPPLVDMPQMAFLQPFLPGGATPYNGPPIR